MICSKVGPNQNNPLLPKVVPLPIHFWWSLFSFISLNALNSYFAFGHSDYWISYRFIIYCMLAFFFLYLFVNFLVIMGSYLWILFFSWRSAFNILSWKITVYFCFTFSFWSVLFLLDMENDPPIQDHFEPNSYFFWRTI